MSPENQFWWFINERHSIYLNKERGDPKPWTKDKILQQYKFTNVFRLLDRVTRAYTNTVQHEFYNTAPDRPDLLVFHTILFRLFNWPNTYRELRAALRDGKWNKGAALRVLKRRERDGEQNFTGAYIVTNAGQTGSKIELYCDALSVAWRRRHEFVKIIEEVGTLQATAEALTTLPMIGKFIAYELVSDLRWNMLYLAPDVNTWAHVGPGALRGLNRVHGWPVGGRKEYLERRAAGEKARPNFKFNQVTGLVEMRRLLEKSPSKLKPHMPELELRDIEHSLCELDKYVRVKLGEGRPRSRYPGTGK